ncbi:MAG TPA: cytochrome c oxidase subunit I [Candidatus Binatia bacterium]
MIWRILPKALLSAALLYLLRRWKREEVFEPFAVPDVSDNSEAVAEEEFRNELEEVWAPPRGFIGWFKNVYHKPISLRMIITAGIFFVLAGILALLMRIQLAVPENTFLGPDLYDQIFTVHGSTMMFLFAVPVMQAMGLYLVPLMIGTRNVAFPRLNTYGFYTYVIGGLMMWVAFLLNVGPDTGWFSYVPLSGPEYSPGKRVDIWAQLVTFTELAALVAAVETIVTTFKMRAPGMSLNRIPIFVWAMLVTSFMVIFAMPAVMVASGILAMDRLVDTHFFNLAKGGDALLWQHLFWFFGHPEVYIIFIPATGIVSTIITTFSRRPIFGYTAIVLSLISTAFLGFGLWVHHMFATGIPQLGQSFFTAASMIIAIPTGIQIFCWIATLWTGRVVVRTPLLFVGGFIATFVLGGLTGVMLASIPFDLQVHDTFFVVAHFHYVLIGGAVFPLLGGFYYWFPKMTGRMPDERIGRLNFWLVFIGFHLTFFPMHQLGLGGMPRRIYTYLPETGWGNLNFVATIGAGILGLGFLIFLVNIVKSLRNGAKAGANPWRADTLEWSVQSPPPSYNFLYLPTVNSRNPLWTELPDQPVVTGMRSDIREVLITNLLDASPDHRHLLDGPAISPFLTAVATGIGIITALFTPWGIVVAAVLLAITLTIWFWPQNQPVADSAREAVPPIRRAA